MKKALLIVLVLVGTSGFLFGSTTTFEDLKAALGSGPIGFRITLKDYSVATGTWTGFRLSSDGETITTCTQYPVVTEGKLTPQLSEFVFTEDKLTLTTYNVVMTKTGPTIKLVAQDGITYDNIIIISLVSECDDVISTLETFFTDSDVGRGA
jgi:hypothetical protein